MPYETTSIKISGSAADSKASVQVEGGDTLAAGQDNPVKVICTAENGDKKEYTIIVKRAAAHDGSVEEKPIESSTTTSAEQEVQTDTTNSGIPIWLLIVVGLAGLLIGIGIGYLVNKKITAKS